MMFSMAAIPSSRRCNDRRRYPAPVAGGGATPYAGEKRGGTGKNLSAEPFPEARQFLWHHRTDYATAYRDFRWPVLDKFNWALDYFDPMAAGNDNPALWIVDEGGGEAKVSFAAMAER